MSSGVTYSVVIPFHNEEGSAEELLRKVHDVMSAEKGQFEIIAVNDGSTDSTAAVIEKSARSMAAVKIVGNPVRKGQTAALAAGFLASSGDTVISLDGDMQNDPADIPLLLKKMRDAKLDVVCGYRNKRNDPAGTRVLSRLGNIFQGVFFGLAVHDISCTLRVYKGEAARGLLLDKDGLHRFIPFLLKRAGYSVGEAVVSHRPREHGVSKYSMKKAPATVKLFLKVLLGKI
ncbi:MAG: glycosyltransferase family 2 protein [Candidatus Omnitrophica bacterium]|nr:glycosyltransferase family 2 protein [Candidatus Omnitrophota bacterium]